MVEFNQIIQNPKEKFKIESITNILETYNSDLDELYMEKFLLKNLDDIKEG